MEKLVCDRCGVEYTDAESIESAKRNEGFWKDLHRRDDVEPRGIIACPNLSCPGELILKEA